LRARSGLVSITGAALLWGTTGVIVRIIHDRSGLSALPIGWYRVALATVAVALALGRAGRHAALRATRRHPARLVLSGLGFGAYQALYFVGVQFVGVSIATLVSLGVAPVALTTAAAFVGHRLPKGGDIAILAAAVCGLTLVCVHPTAGIAAPHPLLGVLASVGSGLGYAAITALSRRMAHEDPLILTGVTSAVAAVALLPLAVGAGLSAPSDPASIGWLGYVGIVPTVLAYWLFYRGLRTTVAEVAGVLTLIEPLTAALLAAAVLHEALSSAALVGAALLLLAVAALYLRDVPPDAGETG
jgi:DME family drug/metabolite transporter